MQEKIQNRISKSRFIILGAVVLLTLCPILFSGCKGKSSEPQDTPDAISEENSSNQTDEKEADIESEDVVKEKDTTGEKVNTENKNTMDDKIEDDKTEDDAEDEEASKEILKSFQAMALDGESFTQEDLAERDMTIINFWATTCGPCISELPDLAELSEALPDRVQVITVCLDGSGQEDLVNELLEEAGYEGITLLSGDGDFLTLCYAVMYTPTTVFIDSDGRLAGDVIIGGQRDFQGVYIRALNKALQESGKEEVELESESKS